jgi:hydro-lyases, Fe-S type, tartrate/fumarate subfamily, beta region
MNETAGIQNQSKQKTYRLTTPLSKEDILQLNAGDIVYLSGTVLTARDEAHLRILEFDEENKSLPFDLENSVIYHCGPVMEKSENGEWNVVAAGPTTSDRMTKMTPEVLESHEIRALIGKGGMENLSDVFAQKCVYLSYTGGCAALAIDMIECVNGVSWEDLGMPEAVWNLTVKEFGPLIVGTDARGNDIFRDVKERAEAVFLKMIE